MKKRFLSFFTALILALYTLSGFVPVKATDGLPDLTVYSPNMIDTTTVRWDPYPGAAYYYIDPMDEFPGDYYYTCEFDPEAVLSYWSCHTGSYNTVITAYNADHQPIAKGRSGVYPYYPLGTMKTPANPRWSGTVAWWDSVTGAESYKIELYEDGIYSQSFYISGQNHADLSAYMVDYDIDYSFKVAARKINFTISDMSYLSSAQRGRFRRIAGNSRYTTGRMVSEQVRTWLYGGYTPLNAVVLANGEKFPDALGGAYLSWQKTAPIILINENTVSETIAYVKNVVKSGSYIYVLGGEGAVSDSWLSGLEPEYKIIRLTGKDRYETNLRILKETGVPDKKLLICTGDNFADALSASAIKYPVMLVSKDGLSDSQKFFLDQLYNTKAIIFGGIGAVPVSVENELKNYVTIETRLAGATRFDTSLETAAYFFGYLQKAVVTTGMNFPDGLTGGLLAHIMNAPLILAATDFDGNKKIHNFLGDRLLFEVGGLQGYVLGGEAAVPASTLFEILNGYTY